ncbi:DNA alkylation repair protein [Leptospira sp. WS92.C1]
MIKFGNAKDVQKALQKLEDPIKANFLAGFFKTGQGDYAEGDIFLGIVVPNQRKIAKLYKNLPLEEIKILLHSPIHEERLTSLFILCDQFKRADPKIQKKLHEFYLKNLKQVNNWDLVDLSARILIGDYLLKRNRKILYKLAKSKNLWERRIAILSTYAFIKMGEFEDTLKIAKELLTDSEDLIQKGVGWMLREVGNQNFETEIFFLEKNADKMPRTMLRYSIEKFPENLKKKFMKYGKKESVISRKKRNVKKTIRETKKNKA